jgi:hypothetical protein
VTGKIEGRWLAHTDKDFVVFIIGIRFKRWWAGHCWLPAVGAMAAMISELARRLAPGCLAGKAWFRRTMVSAWATLPRKGAVKDHPLSTYIADRT